MARTLRELIEGREQRAPQATGRVDIDVPTGVGFRSAMEWKEQGQVVSTRERSHVGVAVVLERSKAPLENDPDPLDSARRGGHRQFVSAGFGDVLVAAGRNRG